MAPSPRPLRTTFSGATALAGFLIATLALAAWLGYQALDAASSQRRTAEAVLEDYAEISAAEFARVARASLGEVLDEIFSPVYRFVRRGSIPSPEVVGWDVDDALRDQECVCPAFQKPLAFFRLDPDGSILLSPDSLPASLGEAINSALAIEQPGPGDVVSGLTYASAGQIADEPVAVGYLVWTDTEGAAEPTFGFVVPIGAIEELFQVWYDDHRLLPAPIAGDQPNDSLLYVSVEEPSGLTLFTSRIAYPTTLSATAPIGPEYGNLQVTAAIRPDAASQLIIGGLPNSRLPLLMGLLLLTLGVGVAAVVQLRREQVFQRLRDDFVSGVSHELRTPLAQIRMFSELQEAGKLHSEEDRKRAVSVISREARRLSHLVENILQFSRLRRTPEQALPSDRTDFAEALADGLDAVTPLVEDRGMRLEVVREDHLPVSANRDALTRVVVNLVDNAVKYGPSGQTIGVTIRRAGEFAQLAVADEGPGVPEADRPKVWKAYRRLDRDVKARLPGTGIGLSVVEELVAAHGGRVRIEDAEGGGANFIVEIPLTTKSPVPREPKSYGRTFGSPAPERTRPGFDPPRPERTPTGTTPPATPGPVGAAPDRTPADDRTPVQEPTPGDPTSP